MRLIIICDIWPGLCECHLLSTWQVNVLCRRFTAPTTTGSTSGCAVAWAELLEEIARLLDGLKPKVRKAFLLAHYDELSYKQVAQQMGVSVRSVGRYTAQALYHCYVLRYET